MAVRLRMKKMGRRHRSFYRICAVDTRRPRDGRVLEELGTYDPMIPDTDARAVLNAERIQHWLSVGAQPSDKVGVLIKKYGSQGTHLAKQKEALDRLAQSRRAPEPPAIDIAASEEQAPETAPPETPAPEAATPEAATPEAAVPEAAAPEAGTPEEQQNTE